MGLYRKKVIADRFGYEASRERKRGVTKTMDKVKLLINGKQVEAKAGQTVLEAALDAGIYIPHLCTHPDLPVQGNCSLCVVQVGSDPSPVKACETPVEEGMTVTVSTEATDHARKTALELILAGHPKDCTGCKAYGNCELQTLMQYMGVVHNRMRSVIRETNNINTKNVLITRDMERCIQCGRCVRACADLRGVGVLEYRKKGWETYVGTHDDMPLKSADCRFCGACVEVCPTGALTDAEGVFKAELPKQERLVPCQATCPADIDIPGFIRFVREGKFDEAEGVIRETTPFAHSLGYVCNNRCENDCKHGKLAEDPISIKNLKRFACEHSSENPAWMGEYLKKAAPTGKKIAIVGAGACGMTAAYFLNRKGHDVTVFEKQKIAGGHMTGGMPEYRIPQKDVLKEVEMIEKAGVKFVYNSPIENVAELKKDYDAVLVALGTSVGKKLGYLNPNNLKQVYSAVDLLRASRLGLPIDLGDTVNIIGGGNVAFDCACTLVRMGKTVNVVCLEKNASQATPEERDFGLEDGANLFDSHSNEEILGSDDGSKVVGLRVHKINSFYFHPETRALVEDPVPDSTYVIPCDSIVFASGQVTGLTADFGIELNRFGYPIDPASGKSEYTSSIEGVFTAGDVITGTKFLVDAVHGGREVAKLMDKYLGGDGDITVKLVDRNPDPKIGPKPGCNDIARQEMAVKPSEERRTNFEPISAGFTCDQANCEAGRCLQCDLRRQITPVKLWTEYAKGGNN